MISLRRDHDVFWLELGTGENRFDQLFLDSLSAALDEVEGHEGPAALVITGSPRFFSNGYDLDWLATLDREGRRAFIRRSEALLARLLVFPVPTVAAIGGHAFGAGALLALASDLRLMRNDHGFFCLPEIDARIPFRRGMNELLCCRLSDAALRATVLTGARLTGPEAARLDIVDSSVPADRLTIAADTIARSLLPKSGPACAALKQALYGNVVRHLRGENPDQQNSA